jgi:hypothetical protein
MVDEPRGFNRIDRINRIRTGGRLTMNIEKGFRGTGAARMSGIQVNESGYHDRGSSYEYGEANYGARILRGN